MKGTNLLIVILVWLSCTANQCKRDDCHNVIPFTNNSDKTLYVCYKDVVSSSDTILGLGSSYFTVSSRDHYKVIPFSVSTTCLVMRKRNCFDIFPMVMIFILDEQKMTTTSQSDNFILRRYDLTQEDLQLLNWEVSYPPDERMKNMRMYPPYGSE